MEIKKVGVVGCGIMGAGIAQVCAQSGYQVVVSEINEELLNKGLAVLNTFLTKGIERGKLSQQDKDDILSRIPSVAARSILLGPTTSAASPRVRNGFRDIPQPPLFHCVGKAFIRSKLALTDYSCQYAIEL